MFENIAFLILGLLIGMGLDDLPKERQEEVDRKKQQIILRKIQEDYDRGYAPDFELYKKMYQQSVK